MKIKTTKKNLLEALNNVGLAVNKSHPEPILRDVLLKAEDHKAVLIGTDLEVGLKVTINGEIQEEGIKQVVLPFNLMKKVTRSWGFEDIEIDVEEKKAFIKYENTKCSIDSLDALSFAILPEVKGNSVIINRKEIIDLINSVSFAATRKDEENHRKEFAGILFNGDGKNLELAATDGTCLAINSIPFNKKMYFIAHWKVLDILGKIKTDSEEVKIVWDDKYIKFGTRDISITSFVIDGHFPPYRSAIPIEFKSGVIIDKDKILKALKRTKTFIGSKRIIVDFSDYQVAIKGRSEEGEWNEKVETENRANISVIFDIDKIINGINHIPDKKILFEINDNLHPIVVRGEGNYKFIIMPQKKLDE